MCERTGTPDVLYIYEIPVGRLSAIGEPRDASELWTNPFRARGSYPFNPSGYRDPYSDLDLAMEQKKNKKKDLDLAAVEIHCIVPGTILPDFNDTIEDS